MQAAVSPTPSTTQVVVPSVLALLISIVALDRKEADFKFQPNQIYKSSPSWNVSVFINVLSRTSDRTVMIKAVEGVALDQENGWIHRIYYNREQNDPEIGD